MEKIIIGRDAYDKIMHYVHKANFEVSGLGVVEVIDNIPTVTDIMLLEQEGSAAATELDADSINKALFDHYESKKEGEIKFWWHSHVNMDVFWSGTDMTTIKELTTNGWFVHGVFNKKGEYRFAASTNDPFEIFMDNLDMEIDESIVESDEKYELIVKIDEYNAKMMDRCDKEFTDKVSQTTYTQYSNYSKHGVGALVDSREIDYPLGGAGNDHYMFGDYSQLDEPVPMAIVEQNRVEALEKESLTDWGYSEEEVALLNAEGVFDDEDLHELEKTTGAIYPGHIGAMFGRYSG